MTNHHQHRFVSPGYASVQHYQHRALRRRHPLNTERATLDRHAHRAQPHGRPRLIPVASTARRPFNAPRLIAH